MRTIVFTLLLLAASLATAATVYKWVDENGVVHYSDQPHANAEKINLKAAQTYKASSLSMGQSPSGLPAPPSLPPQPNAYQGCNISQPADAQTFANLDALTIVVMTDPGLRGGDAVFLTLDGQLLNNGQPTGPQFTLSPVDRGEHTLQAVIRDAHGAVVCQSPSVSFSVHQPSIANPVSPVRPH
jgi:Domain of unknown function (DUF4124)